MYKIVGNLDKNQMKKDENIRKIIKKQEKNESKKSKKGNVRKSFSFRLPFNLEIDCINVS